MEGPGGLVIQCLTELGSGGPRGKETGGAEIWWAHAELGPVGAPGAGSPVGQSKWIHRPIGQGLGEKSSTVPKFRLSLVFYLSQGCLQQLSKVLDSWNSCSLQLCPSCHLGSPLTTIFDWGYLNVPVPSQGWYAGLSGDGCCPSLSA
jgi:hypothetical protein